MITKIQWEVLYKNLESCLVTFQLNYPNYKHRQQAVKDVAKRKVDDAIDYARLYLEQYQEARNLIEDNARFSNGQTFKHDKFFNVEWFERDLSRFLKLIRDKINNMPN